MGSLTSKVPLIIIVAPEICIVNRQCGVGDSKYVVTFDPLPSGHMTPRVTFSSKRFIMWRLTSKLPLIITVAP